ncbi:MULTISPECIES: DUF1128 domain-containing protein [Marinococcus]|jgi:uncharacterized protein YfkK (UPF0435 family)|uniref:DUF1128 domain-containing protein n=1 Tax=Marinococcus TaxID=1370 RepID=UPI0026046A10|nr:MULTISPECIES: DUF1128 domain-containing protein [Marinococcus]MDX6152435.1 DUF1128 domain-containing protein [Marinococcus sp. PL1-022]MDZ5781778.1 DUF1128 domain-containing protein [Marinococcus luteus]
MSLEQASRDNLDYMITELQKKLQIVNVSVMQPEHYDVDQYHEIKEIYDMVDSKNNISVSEMQAIVSELGHLRKG